MSALGGRRRVAAVDRPGEPAEQRTVPIVFGKGRSLLGVLTYPAGIASRDIGVVVCGPLGLQNICTYRPLRTLARRLADQGVPVLRFDWPGCGDSAEAPPRRAAAVWLESVHEAVAALRESAAVGQVALVGLRIGATIAMLEAIRDETIERVALLAPYLSGRAYLRELAAFEMLVERTAFTEPASPPPPQPAGTIEAGGFLISADERQALATLDLGSLEWSGHVPGRVLVVSAQSDRGVESLARHLAAGHSGVTARVAPELARVWDSSQTSFLPPSCRRLVVDWLLADAPPAAARPAPPAVPAARLTLESGAVREEAVMLDTARGRLFTVTCKPAHHPADDWVVFLNTGRVRRAGTSRLATVWARRWARAGVASLRLDVVGVGDSDGDGDGDEVFDEDPGPSYAPAILDDLRTALDWLGAHHRARRFMVVGLCSGATLAYQLALADPRVVGVGMVNSPAFFWDDRLPQLLAWDEAQSAGLGPVSLLGAARSRGKDWARRALAGGALTLRGAAKGAWHRHEVRDSLADLAARGCRVVTVYSDRDTGLWYLGRALGPDFRSELDRLGVTVEIVEGPDHTFRPVWSQAVLERSLEALLGSIGFLGELDQRPSDVAVR